jgi:hypothetical protein
MAQELLDNKCLHNKILSQVTVNPTISHFWKGLMSVKDNFFSSAPFNTRKGKRLGFGKIPGLEDLLLLSSTDHFTTSCGAKKM